MRTLRLSLAATVILALLGGLGGVVAAQEEAATATYVTGTVISDPGWSSPESESFEGGVDQLLGMRVERQVEWSDPRLPATMATNMNLAFYDTGATWAQTHLLDGPEGTWTATERGFELPDGTLGLVVLTGEGAYEGLSALLVGRVTAANDTVYEGVIFEGVLPEYPEPVD